MRVIGQQTLTSEEEEKRGSKDINNTFSPFLTLKIYTCSEFIQRRVNGTLFRVNYVTVPNTSGKPRVPPACLDQSEANRFLMSSSPQHCCARLSGHTSGYAHMVSMHFERVGVTDLGCKRLETIFFFFLFLFKSSVSRGAIVTPWVRLSEALPAASVCDLAV